MANCKKCDRCGSYYEEDNDGKQGTETPEEKT